MNTCEQHYKAVIVFDGKGCPLCDAEKVIDDWEKQDSEQRGKIESLEQEIRETINRDN